MDAILIWQSRFPIFNLLVCYFNAQKKRPICLCCLHYSPPKLLWSTHHRHVDINDGTEIRCRPTKMGCSLCSYQMSSSSGHWFETSFLTKWEKQGQETENSHVRWFNWLKKPINLSDWFKSLQPVFFCICLNITKFPPRHFRKHKLFNKRGKFIPFDQNTSKSLFFFHADCLVCVHSIQMFTQPLALNAVNYRVLKD
jgi:hypothetical protein